jgi:hypothetical protein
MAYVELAKSPDDKLFSVPAIRHLLCVLCLAACPMAGTARPPNIILITLDTVRADRMGFLGSHRGLTPTLDSLARQSVVFPRATAADFFVRLCSAFGSVVWSYNSGRGASTYKYFPVLNSLRTTGTAC